LAKQREFTEPFLLDDDAELASLREEALAAGLKITRGGRFYHLIGVGQDKGKAVRRVIEIFRENRVGELLTVAIGDRPNDFSMLSAVDIPVLMPHPDGRYEELILPNLLKAPYPGSLGWGEAVMGILEGLKAVTG
jgi:mannosyl-3-phosphoglycerate phosphatase